MENKYIEKRLSCNNVCKAASVVTFIVSAFVTFMVPMCFAGFAYIHAAYGAAIPIISQSIYVNITVAYPIFMIIFIAGLTLMFAKSVKE